MPSGHTSLWFRVACTVTAPDGAQVRGLTRNNFRLFEDGVSQEISAFDASATPASIALVVDASPSIYHDLAEMRGAAHALAENLSPADEIAAVSFSSEAHLLLPFSTNRALLDRAIDSKYLARVENSSESKIYESLFYTARELFSGRTGRKAIVLLTDGQDSGLGLTWNPYSAQPGSGGSASRLAFDDVARELGSDGIALFIVSTENRPRGMTPEWLAAHQGAMLINEEARKSDMPHYTLYLAELSRRVGGQLYFLREIGNLSEIYRRIALAISAQYTLGYYPSAGTAKPGWRSLRVEEFDLPMQKLHPVQSSYIVAPTTFQLFSRIPVARLFRSEAFVPLNVPRQLLPSFRAKRGIPPLSLSNERGIPRSARNDDANCFG